MNISDISRHRMSTQRLIGPPFGTPQEMVRWHGAVQSQEFADAKWGIAQRCQGVTDADMNRLFNEGRILRTHILRPTWHFVPPEDIRWMLALTSPRVHALNRSRYRDFEVDTEVVIRGQALMTTALRDGAFLTRTELSEALRQGGIEATGPRLAALVMHSELDGLICSGPRRGKQLTYALLDERVPPTPAVTREEALVALVYRYFSSHGPATPHDFAWWSGLTVTDARAGLALLKGTVASERIGETTWYFVPSVDTSMSEAPSVHLLPPFDEYFVGFRSQEPTFLPETWERWGRTKDVRNVFPIAVDGIISGGWRRQVKTREVVVSVPIAPPLDPAGWEAMREAAAGYGRFHALPVVLDAELPVA